MSDRKKKKVHTAQVVRHGEKLVVPDDLELNDAADILVREHNRQNEWVNLDEMVDAWPYDGARALRAVLEERFGFARNVSTTQKGFFGSFKVKPQQRTIAIGFNETEVVPWGNFQIPGVDGEISTDVGFKGNRPVLRVTAEVRRKNEETVRTIVQDVRNYLRENSIYRGAAIRMNFEPPADDRPIAEPRFMDTSDDVLDEIVFNRDLEQAIEESVLTPIKHADACRNAGIPLKRGVLLAGEYGVGKTLLARAVSVVAARNDWTFLYIDEVDQLPEAIEFARTYQPCVIFAEDADRVMAKRDDAANEILNTIDGIESKGAEIMVALTTNHLDNIHPAMLRPGRLDAVIKVEAPDAEAVTRLFRVYGRDLIEADADLAQAGEALAGQIPAVVREAVERAKLASLRRTEGDFDSLSLNGDDLLSAAKQMRAQVTMLRPPATDERSHEERVAEATGRGIGTGMGPFLRGAKQREESHVEA